MRTVHAKPRPIRDARKRRRFETTEARPPRDRYLTPRLNEPQNDVDLVGFVHDFRTETNNDD